MIVLYLIGFLLLCGATVLLLGLTPESIRSLEDLHISVFIPEPVMQDLMF